MKTKGLQFVGVTWREIKTGRVTTTKYMPIIAAIRTALNVGNRMLWFKLSLTWAVVLFSILVIALYFSDWTFVGHTPQFWSRVTRAIFYSP